MKLLDYSNSSTNYSQRYTLTVVVNGDRVVQINLGMVVILDIILMNMENMKVEIYRLKELSGQIVGATTTVKYREDNGSILTFKIQL